MTNEIKRNTWTRFCKKFSAANQYRSTQLTLSAKKSDPSSATLMPFMGVAISKKGRMIDGVEFFAGKPHPEKVAEPVMTIQDPAKIYLEKDKNGTDCRLRIRSKDGTEACLELIGEPEPSGAHTLVEKVAYSLYEKRSFTPGSDFDDWLEAERKVQEAEALLTK